MNIGGLMALQLDRIRRGLLVTHSVYAEPRVTVTGAQKRGRPVVPRTYAEDRESRSGATHREARLQRHRDAVASWQGGTA